MRHAPVFVLSCARSGSTLLRYMLDAHPDVACPAELHLAELCGSLYHATLGTVGALAGKDRATKRAVSLLRVREIIDELMSGYAKARGKHLWCEKSPRNLRNVQALVDVFPDARYVCLYRQPMDVIASLLDFTRLHLFAELLPYCQRNEGNLVAAMADYWTDSTRLLLDFEHHHRARTIRARYEDLVSEPESALARIFAFLHLPPAPLGTQAVFGSAQDPGAGDRKILFRNGIDTSSVGRGRNVPRENIPVELRDSMNEVLGRIGYPEVTAGWDDGAPAPVSESSTDRIPGIEEFLRSEVPRRLTARRAPAAVCKIVLTGHSPELWRLDLREPEKFRVTNEDGEADCVVALTAGDFLDIARGRMNPATAYHHGRLRIGGNFSLAVEIGRCMFGV